MTTCRTRLKMEVMCQRSHGVCAFFACEIQRLTMGST